MKRLHPHGSSRRTFLALSGTFLSWTLLPRQAIAKIWHDERPPRPKPIKDDTPDDSQSASIQLWPTPVLPDLWTVVQWVDGQEQWHDVEGWRGNLNRKTYVSWRVLQSEFGKGPFRWVVYDVEGGNVLVISELFHLPSNNGEILKIKVTLSEPS